MFLSVIIPVYNEEQTVSRLIQAVKAVALPGMDREIIVVNDGSTDGTAGALGRFDGDRVVRVFHQTPNRGKTEALRRGIREARGDIVLVQDADLEYNPSQYPSLLEPLLRQEADVVYGSRFLGTIRGMAPVNRWANVVSNLTFNLLFGTRLTDINTCFKVFRAADIKGVSIVSDRFAFETEVTAKLVRRGLRLVEVPVAYEARSLSQGKKIDWFRALDMYAGIFRHRFSGLG